ncbi:MAG: alpha-galactosidase [Clostridia bacterium]|nr:alpha-galactosidase [Clostridia bacterium]
MNALYSFVKEHLLSNFAVTANRTRHRTGVLTAFTEDASDGRIVCTYTPAAGLKSLTITAKIGEDAIVFALDAQITVENGKVESFDSEDALTMTLGDLTPDALLGSRHYSPWWMHPSFIDAFAAIEPRTQSLLVKSGALNYHLLPLTGDNFRCELEAGLLRITSDCGGIHRLSGDFLAASVSTDPYQAVSNNYTYAREIGAIRVPLRAERQLPDFFRSFGWCTWDAFYGDVSSDKIYAKLDEFKTKGIPVKWIIIDDGWMTTRNNMLAGFDVNREKFPEGLKATIDRIKGEYGIEKVGVWHAFNGYWMGVDPESPLYEEQKENLFTTPAGTVLQSLDEDKAFRFWDAWHSHLASCGVDFLKVDNQSSNSAHLEGSIATAAGCRIAHNAIERSITKHFGGAVINCMGMDMENVFARPMSAVSRNSDDFFPKRERSFIVHLTQNVYNAIWHSQLYHCDFDMWWSNHVESAYQSGVLRAIAGSPIYVSDKIGESRADTILAAVESDGTVMLCDEAARPTLDCVYTDCVKEGKLQKVWNRSGDCFALAAFNVSEGDVTDTVDFGTIPGLSQDCEYIAYEYFSKTFTRINYFEDTELTLPRDGVTVWSIYPITKPDEDSDEGAYIMLGDTGKYVPIASKYKVKTFIKDIL